MMRDPALPAVALATGFALTLSASVAAGLETLGACGWARSGTMCADALGMPIWLVSGVVVITLAVGTVSIGVLVRRALRLRCETRELLGSLGPLTRPGPRLADAAATHRVTPTVKQSSHHEPVAFCTGLWRPTIVMSDSAVNLLTDEQLKAVLLHEAHHAAARDPLRLAVVKTVAALGFLLPALSDVAQRAALQIEHRADRAAVRSAGALPLLEALIAMYSRSQQPARGNLAHVAALPRRVEGIASMTSPSHPVRWRALALTVLAFVPFAAFVVLTGAGSAAVEYAG